MSRADAPGAADRFARQRLIPGWDQERLAAATVIVIGVGALGNEAAKNLALAGIGRLVICDPDVVSESNLSRTMLFGPSDVGTPKAVAATASIRRLSPMTDAEPRVADLVRGVGLGELADADLVIGCVDTRRARLQLLGRCTLVGTPLIDGGTSPSGAELRLRVSAAESCFACAMSPHQRSVSDLPWSCAEPFGDELPQAAGIAATAVGAGWLAATAFGVILKSLPSWRVLSIDVNAGAAGPVTVTRDPDCPLHRPLDEPPVASTASHESTVAAFLATLNVGDEPATWSSFPLPIRCRRCRYTRDGSLAPGAVLPCPRCGLMLRQERSTRLRDADPAVTLAVLGVAPEEILPVVRAGGEIECHRLKASPSRRSQ